MTEKRRPIKTRDVALAQRTARWLSSKNLTPNQISVASVFFALLTAICLILLPAQEPINRIALLILAALFIQCRLLCNLFDGMVAMEGGKSTASGELFNDVPDRIADPLILVAAGYSIGHLEWGISLGWCAAMLAVFTAYVRVLASSIGAPADFRGPMAKQQRMALMTAGCLFTLVEPLWWPSGYIFFAVLMLISIGCIITAVRRLTAAYRFLESTGQKHK